MEKTLDYYLNLNYPIEVKKSDEDGGGYSASIPMLGECAFVGTGDTVEEAIESLNSIKRYLFEDYLSKGLRIHEPPKTILTKEELLAGYIDSLTVDKLLKFIKENKIPLTAKVMIQRIEDMYFEENHWEEYTKKITCKDPAGKTVVINTTTYHPASFCVKYEDDADLLFIDLHW